MQKFTFELDIPPGINSDDTAFSAKGRWIAGNNVRFWRGKPETIGGWVQLWDGDGITPLVSPMNGEFHSIFAWNRAAATGGIAVAFGSTSSNPKLVVSHNVTTLAGAADRTPASVPALPLTGAEYWCFDAWGETLLASLHGYTLYEQTGTSQATDVTNAPDTITFMLVTESRQVMTFGCNEEVSGTFNAMCIRFSDIEDYTDWTTSSTNNAGEIILSGPGALVAGVKLGDYVLAWTTDSLYLGQFLGDPLQPWSFDLIDDKCGLLHAKAFTVLGSTVYWLATDRQFRSYRVGAFVQIVPCTVWNDFESRLPGASLSLRDICMGTVSKYGEVWCFYNDGTGRYVAFSTLDGSWFTGIKDRVGWLDTHAIGGSGAFRTTYETTVIGVSSNGGVHAEETGKTGSGSDVYSWSLKSGGQYIESGKRRVQIQQFTPDFDGWSGSVSNIRLRLYMQDYPSSSETTKGPYDLAIPPSGWLVNGTINEGATTITVDSGSGGFVSGSVVTFAGVNDWVDGADSGKLARFTTTANFHPGGFSLAISPAMNAQGASRNVSALPADNAAVSVVSNPHRSQFRASGRIMSVGFTSYDGGQDQPDMSLRFGKPTFDCAPMGMR